MNEKTKDEKVLKSLAHLDIDAWHAYGQAIEKIEDTDIRQRLTEFRDEHRQHVDRLSEKMRKMGIEPPEFTKDFKGYLIEGMTTLQSSMGTKGALKAMETNEKLTNKKYAKALEGELSADVKTLVEENYQDEKKHLAFVQEKLQAL